MIFGENGLAYVPAGNGTLKQRRSISYLRFPSQKKFDELTEKFIGFSGPIGCQSFETIIDNPFGESLSIGELCERGIAPIVQTLEGPVQAEVPFRKGMADLYEVTLQTGETILVTRDHLFLTSRGWLPLSLWQSGEELARYVPCLQDCINYKVSWSTVRNIRFVRSDYFYDIHVPNVEHYFAHGMIHHNSGKSRALVMQAIKMAYLNPNCRGLIGTSTYRLLTDSTMVEMFSMLDEKDIPYTFRKSSYSIFLKEPQSTILFRTLDEPERLRAMNLAWFGVDELSYCKEASWTRLEGRLRDPKAKVKCGFAVWTPKGKDWVWRRFISTRKQPNYHAVLARPFENRAVLDSTPDFYHNLKLSYDEKFYRQEVLGEYLDMFSGTVYHAFSERNIRPAIFNPSLPLQICMDFNYSPMAGCVCQSSTSYGYSSVQVLQEIVLPSSHAAAWCQEMLARTASMVEQVVRTGKTMEMHFYGDASGGSHSAQSADTTWQIVQKFMSAFPHIKTKFLYKKKNPLVVDRVNATNAMLCSFGGKHETAGEVRLFIDPSCKELMTDFEDCVWSVDAAGNSYGEINKKDPKRTHAADSCSYMLEQTHGLGVMGHATSQTF